MSINYIQIIKIILLVIPFLLMTIRSGKINLPRDERGHQFAMPFIALIYCIFMMVQMSKVEAVCLMLVQKLSELLAMLPIIGNFLHHIFEYIYRNSAAGYGLQLLVNTCLMLLFCLIKRISLPIIKSFWASWRWLYNQTSANFYYAKGNSSYLYERFGNTRAFFRVMYYTTVELGALTCFLSLLFRKDITFRFPFYPIFGIIMIGEIFFLLNGVIIVQNSEEEEDDPTLEKEPDCDQIMAALQDKFGDRVNLADQIPDAGIRKQKHDYEKELGTEDIDGIIAAYFTSMQNGGEEINPDYVHATKNLLHGRSVLIHNPFYHDMTSYILLPMFHEMLNHHNCLVVCGRMNNEEDIVNWLKEGIRNVTNLPKLWKIEKLDYFTANAVPDIGILSFDKLYNLENLRSNSKFFQKTTFIILLEPSNILGTGQIGLRSILQYCEAPGKKLTYCALDRNADGLVDALSHAVRQSITEVTASPTSMSSYCRMFWRAEGNGMQTRILPRISHYLGVGGELASLAMHEGANRVHWFSGSKMPLVDLQWNIEQYYNPICQYTHLSREQSELNSRFHFHQELWQADFPKKSFVMVEDEFCNVFEISRTFAARLHNKGFINVISESYMLRDYMCDNKELFSNDPKAIPSIVPDYARTQRNFVLRTLMLMAIDAVEESVLSRELALHGCETKYPFHELCKLIKTHTGIENPKIQTIRNEVMTGRMKTMRFSYKADAGFVEDVFNSELKSAYYVVENEKMETYPMGNRLMGHIEQVLLPGQFFSYDGKYYEVRSISTKNGIIVRRAADHITGRNYYRQLRNYTISLVEYIENARHFRGLRLQNAFADIRIVTDGYLEMMASNYLKNCTITNLDYARERDIVHKELFKVDLPDVDPKVCFTLCVLFNELFKTIYPNEDGYLIATMSANEIPAEITGDVDYNKKIRSLVPYLIASNATKPDEKKEGCSIYFIEDSPIDLGLLVSLERNFQRLMEILCDYLDWYLDSSRKKGEEKEDQANDVAAEESKGLKASKQTLGDEIASSDVDGEDEEIIDDGSIPQGYHRNRGDDTYFEYLTYGFGEIPSWLALKDTLDYLVEHDFDNSNLQRSRKTPPDFDEGSTYDPKQPGVHYCDFCGCALNPGEYDVLKDGRERCPECGKDAVKTRKQFKRVYEETLGELQQHFGIKIEVPIKVRMVNARKVNDGFDDKGFVPTPGFDARVLGYAQRSKDGYKLLVENGAPLWKMKSTLVHELTHIWQFTNWNDGEVQANYPQDSNIAYEGMAVWTEIQYLIAMGQKERAIRYKRNRDLDPSVYGVGMKLFLKKYPVQTSLPLKHDRTPFDKFPKVL